MSTDLDNDVKLQQHYDSSLMHKYVSFMEMYGELSMDESLDEKKRKAAEMLFRHYRRMVICMATKDFHPNFQCLDTIRLREMIELLSDAVVNNTTQYPGPPACPTDFVDNEGNTKSSCSSDSVLYTRQQKAPL